MKPVEFEEKNVTFAKDQHPYVPMPAHISRDGVVTCCWELSPQELQEIFSTGRIWHQVQTFNGSLQPQRLTVNKPTMQPMVGETAA